MKKTRIRVKFEEIPHEGLSVLIFWKWPSDDGCVLRDSYTRESERCNQKGFSIDLGEFSKLTFYRVANTIRDSIVLSALQV